MVHKPGRRRRRLVFTPAKPSIRKHRVRIPINNIYLDPNPEGTQKNLDHRRYGGREEQRIPHVGGGAGAAQGVTGHLRALGDRTGCTVTNDGASVPSTDPGVFFFRWTHDIFRA